jgi:hypothetical protein
MGDIDADKLEAALGQLEAEQARRRQARVDSGEVIVWTITVVCARDEDTETEKARVLANLPTSDPEGRAIYYDVSIVVTGVPRADPNDEAEQVQPASEEGTLSSPSEVEQAPGGADLSPAREPAYIYVTTIQATEDDPGQIAEGLWSVEDGGVVVTDLAGKYIGGRALLKDEDPLPAARVLLREAEKPKDFNRPIHYQKLGLA